MYFCCRSCLALVVTTTCTCMYLVYQMNDFLFFQEDLEDLDCVDIPNLEGREAMIKSVLEQTNKAIDDIDNLLSTSKCFS